MPHSKTAAWSILPNQKAVDQTIHRLTQSGFSRNVSRSPGVPIISLISTSTPPRTVFRWLSG